MKQWFVLHTLSGHEGKVKTAMDRRVVQEEMQDCVEQVLIPTETVQEVKQGKRITSTRKFFPGYVLAKLDLYDDTRELNERTWYFIQETPGVIGFVGGNRPVPLRDDEVRNLLSQIEERSDKVQPKIEFETGETVKINDGPFENFTGVVDEVDPERGKLKISVSIFGRSAPVEVEYWQVEKA